MNHIKAHLRGTTLFIYAKTIYSLLLPSLRNKRRKELNKLSEIYHTVGDCFRAPLYSDETNLKSVLIMGMGSVSLIAQEVAIRKSFELAGYRCYVLIPMNAIVIKAYRLLGCDQLVFLDRDSFFTRRVGNKLIKGCKSLNDVLRLSANGIRFGKSAVSTLMRKMRIGSFNLEDRSVKNELATALNNSFNNGRQAQKILEEINPDALVLVDRGYSPSSELFDLCIRKEIPVITWNAAHRNGALILKRYTHRNKDAHPSSLSNDTWERIKSISWSEEKSDRVLKEIKRCYTSGEWYGEVGTQVNKQFFDKSTLQKKFNLNPCRKTVAIFPHIFWDATFFWGTDLFESYEQWFIESVKAACRNPNVNWIVKVHPANIVKDYRDNVFAQHSEITAINKNIEVLPEHVKLLAADTEVSTLSLFNLIDACVTVRGTTGIEAACFGVPVLTAGTGRYDRLGFTHDSNSPEEFISRMADIQNYEPLTTAQQELALRYAFGVLIARPVNLRIYRMKFRKTKTADLDIAFDSLGIDELKKLEDLNSIAAWIVSEKEDFVNWGVF